MGFINDLKSIWKRNVIIHGRIVNIVLYLEYVSRWKFPFKVIRRIVIQHLYLSEISPVNFNSSDAIVSLRLPHPYMVILNADCKIGNNCTLFHNVTIGALKPNVKGAAHIGDNVYIGCGATILGGGKNI